jgi:hypothetical protein
VPSPDECLTATATAERESPRHAVGRGVESVAAATRVADWWDYKLTPPLAVLWAAAIQADRPLLSCWRQALALVSAVAVCAAYVSLINEHFDRDEDARSGRPNRLAGWSRRAIVALVAACVLAGTLFLAAWLADWPVAGAYLGSWIAFTLYSAPPLRLKTRGLPGVIADAAGACLFPCLLAVALATRATGRAPGSLWLGGVAAWSFGYGLRGILWHQLADLGLDRRGGVRTFAARSGAASARGLTHYVAVPLEIAGLAIVLWLTRSLLPPVFLLGHLALVAARERVWGAAACVGWPMLLDEYNDGQLPVALLLASATAHRADLWLLPLLLLLFRRTVRPTKHASMLAAVAAHRAGVALARLRARASSANAEVNASDSR